MYLLEKYREAAEVYYLVSCLLFNREDHRMQLAAAFSQSNTTPVDKTAAKKLGATNNIATITKFPATSRG
jgi:hypothetical protein